MGQSEMCAAVLAPIRRIPAEILGEIFLWCLPQMPHPDVEKAPLLLCRISRFWRHVAESIPQLWCKVGVLETDLRRYGLDPKRRFDSRRKNIIPIIREWISRAGPHLPLSLYLGRGTTSIGPETAQQLVDILTEYSPRCRTLHIRPPDPRFFDSFFSLPSSHIPLLESATLMIFATQTPMVIFESAPRLRHLSITYPTDRHEILHPFPWSQLTYLAISDNSIHITFWVTIFSQCTMLQHGVFSVRTNDYMGHGLGGLRANVTLHHLHDLDLTFDGTLSDLLDSFRLPVLKKLCLRMFMGSKRFETRHDLPQLQSLSFVGGVMPYIGDLLELAISVSELTFSRVDPSNLLKLLSNPTPNPNEKLLLPNLRTITHDSRVYNVPIVSFDTPTIS
ncbi:hypothetical protein BDZ94DRAFT_759795 [Collybia nuda]|uniref:F-box domain-containing protein n=1 Tax=Collybia nuda TaxID=64659 RepID=A0A9P6CH84_9AGAR|nr:hypothetical protein BDZ94DRAFT_759795 [Collybia nuda]